MHTMSVFIRHESLLVLALCHDTMSLVGEVRIQFLLIELVVHAQCNFDLRSSCNGLRTLLLFKKQRQWT